MVSLGVIRMLMYVWLETETMNAEQGARAHPRRSDSRNFLGQQNDFLFFNLQSL